jgi:hypothetical protein
MATLENNTIIVNYVEKKFLCGQIDNDCLVQLIELCGSYLNLKTIPDYAKQNNMTYNGAKKPNKYGRKVLKLLNVKFVIDNY